MVDAYRENARPADAPEPEKEMTRDERALDYLHTAAKNTDNQVAMANVGKAIRELIYEHAEFMTTLIRAQEDNMERRHKELIAALGYDLKRDGDTTDLIKRKVDGK